MRKHIKKIALLLLSFVLIFLIALTAYHNVMLNIEKKKIAPVGTKVKIDGYNMNVYTEGKRSHNDAVMVLLSGSVVTSPIYDYKILYSKLTDEYEVCVIEKFGYGYSDQCRVPRDIATVVEEDRKALREANVLPPYILMPHSMSGLEAVYWADAYPDEVEKIIGLDMAVPSFYKKEILAEKLLMNSAAALRFMGIQRILYPVNQNGLTDEEYEQNKILTYRNALNENIAAGYKAVYDNAKIVDKMGVPNTPILMFSTNFGKQGDYESWVKSQEDFAERATDCIQIKMECDHMLHYNNSEYVAEKIKEFLEETPEYP
jgi:pimeloyl-ACP methyl ester carboxylesterase